MKKRKNAVLLWVVIAAVMLLLIFFDSSRRADARHIEYPQLLEMIRQDQVEAVAVRGSSLVGLKRGSKVAASDFPDRNYDFETTIGEDFIDTAKELTAGLKGLAAEDVTVSDLSFTITYRPPLTQPWWYAVLPYVILMAMLLAFIYFTSRASAGAANGRNPANFGRSTAQMQDPSQNKVTFADVAGMDEEKEELQEMVDFLRNPRSYTEVGARIPKGVLLVGPPGNGKTLLARAVAGEAGVPFFSISGSDFVELFVGVGASRVRDLFNQAKRAAPAIVFIDEIDAVGRHRGAGLGGGHDEREQTLNQLLVEMDGFRVNEGVIVMAATNRRDILDPALLRPGRFDRQVTVNYPDQDGRVAILRVHSKGKPLAEDVDLENIAKRMPYATGADLENVMNEAAILTARKKKTEITQAVLVEAIARVQMGPEKKSHKVHESDRRMVAVHESGHAVVGHFLPGCDDVHLVTIVPRGGAAGHTLSLPGEEHDSMSRTQMLDTVCMMLGGHAAEEVILGEIYTGSSSDLQRATELCRRMVTQFGMSDEIGPVYLAGEQEVFVGMEFGQRRECSEETARRIDEEVHRMLSESYARAKDTIRSHAPQLDRLVGELLREETVDRAAFLRLMEAEQPVSLRKDAAEGEA